MRSDRCKHWTRCFHAWCLNEELTTALRFSARSGACYVTHLGSGFRKSRRYNSSRSRVFLEKLIVAQNQENHRMLWNQNVHYRVIKSQPLVSISSHVNLVHIVTLCFWRNIDTRFNIILAFVPRFLKGSLLFKFSNQNWESIFHSSRPVWSHPPWSPQWYLVVGTNYESPHYVIFSFAVTSCLFDPNIFLSMLFSDTINVCSSLWLRYQASYPYKDLP